MKIAVLGTGFGAYHTEIYRSLNEDAKIILWGRNEEKLQELKEKFKVETTTDMEDIFADREVELIDICLPNVLHKDVAIKAMQAGKHVYIETPIAETMEDAVAIMEAAKEYNKKVFVDLFLRFEYPYEQLYKIQQSGKYGKLKELHVWRQTPHWWGNMDLDHIVTNLMMHDIDFVTRLLGQGMVAHASGVTVREEESLVSAIIKYDGAIAEIRGSSAMPSCNPFSVGFEALFEQGYVRYYEDGYADGELETKMMLFSNGGEKEEIILKTGDCYKEGIQHVLTCLASGEESFISGTEAVKSLQMALAIRSNMQRI